MVRCFWQPFLRWLEWETASASALCALERGSCCPSCGALVTVSPPTLCSCSSVSLLSCATAAGHLGCPGCGTCSGIPTLNGRQVLETIFFKPTFFQCISSIPKLYMQGTAKTIRCTAIQEIRVIALWVCKADKPQEQSLRAGCSGSGSKGNLFSFTKNPSPNQAPPGCITKDQNKQVQICAVAPYFPNGALCSF